MNLSMQHHADRMIAHEQAHLAQRQAAFIDEIIGQYAQKGDRVRLCHPTAGGTELFVNGKRIGIFEGKKLGLVFKVEMAKS